MTLATWLIRFDQTRNGLHRLCPLPFRRASNLSVALGARVDRQAEHQLIPGNDQRMRCEVRLAVPHLRQRTIHGYRVCAVTDGLCVAPIDHRPSGDVTP